MRRVEEKGGPRRSKATTASLSPASRLAWEAALIPAASPPTTTIRSVTSALIDGGADLGGGPHRPGDRRLLGDLGQPGPLVVPEGPAQGDLPVDPPAGAGPDGVDQPDVDPFQGPLLAVGVHPQGDRGAGPQAGQQQPERRGAGGGPTLIGRLLGGRRRPAG